MAVCFTNGATGIIFVDKHKFWAYKIHELEPRLDPEALERALGGLFARNPEWKRAYESRIQADAFCNSCGHFEFDYAGGEFVCGECSMEFKGEFDGLLVPSFLAGNLPQAVEKLEKVEKPVETFMKLPQELLDILGEREDDGGQG